MAEEPLNIYQKLAKVRKQVEVIQRNKKGYGYSYVSEDEIMSKISVFLDKLNLSLIPSIVGDSTKVEPYHYTKTKSTKEGKIYEEQVNELLVHSDMEYTWVNNDNPEEQIKVGWAMVGQQADASQAFGSGLSYAARYFLLKYFNVATPNDDPDEFRRKQKEAEAAEEKQLISELISAIDAYTNQYLERNPGEAKQIKQFFAQYVAGGNYFKLKDSKQAAEVLSKLEETFKN